MADDHRSREILAASTRTRLPFLRGQTRRLVEPRQSTSGASLRVIPPTAMPIASVAKKEIPSTSGDLAGILTNLLTNILGAK